MFFYDSFREKYVDRPVELEHVKYPEYLAKWEIFSEYNSIPVSRRHCVYSDRQDSSGVARTKYPVGHR